LKRGELWWADLGAHRPMEQTGRRPVVVWQSDALTRALASVLVVPLTTNLDRAHLAGMAVMQATEGGLSHDSVAIAFQIVETERSARRTRLFPSQPGFRARTAREGFGGE
jgi:mRNA-degrading endonuclease toxin of MazEF toxin-antitoxin module